MSIGARLRTSRKVPAGPSAADARAELEVAGERYRRSGARAGVAGDALAVVEMDPDVLAHLHGDARADVDAIDARLYAAPDADAGGEFLVDGAGDGQRGVGEQVAAAKADDTALGDNR